MGEDVADGKSSRPWAMHGQPPGRPPGLTTEYSRSHPRSHSSSHTLFLFLFWKSIIGRLSNRVWALYGVWRSFPILKFDPWLISLKGNEGFGGFEADRLRDRILCTQRTWRGRDRDFIYTKNVAQPRSGFYLHNEFRAAGVRFCLQKRFMVPALIRI